MRSLILALVLAGTSQAVAAPADDLGALMDKVWASALRENPVMATSL